MDTIKNNKNSRWKDLPDIVMIELTNHCNFRCTMCSNMNMRRKRSFMNYSVFKKAIDRCKEDGIKNIKLYTTGESLLHPEFMKFWKLIITYPFDWIMISTNGLLLNEDIVRELTKSKKLRIQFSFSGYDKKSYQLRYMPGKFNDAIDKIHMIIRLIDEAGLPKNTLTINGVAARKYSSIQKSRDFLKKEFSLNESQVHIYHMNNWNHIINSTNNKLIKNKDSQDLHVQTKKHYCHIANTRMGILYDGSITTCGCIDVNGELIIGDIFNQSIKEARKGKLSSDFRQKLKTGDISQLICSRCESLKNIR